MNNKIFQSTPIILVLFFLTFTTYPEVLKAQPFIAEVIYHIEGSDFTSGPNIPLPPTSTNVLVVYALSFDIGEG